MVPDAAGEPAFLISLDVLGLDLGEEVREGGLVAGVAWQDFIGEGKAVRSDNQGDDDLHAVGPLVATVAGKSGSPNAQETPDSFSEEIPPSIEDGQWETRPYFPLMMRFLLGLALTVATGSISAADLSEIEKHRLFEPTESELRAEAAGRVYIYDSLRESDVARAMDVGFERVETMMFVRVKKTDAEGKVLTNPETGTALVDDDGC